MLANINIWISNSVKYNLYFLWNDNFHSKYKFFMFTYQQIRSVFPNSLSFQLRYHTLHYLEDGIFFFFFRSIILSKITTWVSHTKKKTIHYVVKKVKPFIYFYYILNVTINKNYLAWKTFCFISVACYCYQPRTHPFHVSFKMT